MQCSLAFHQKSISYTENILSLVNNGFKSIAFFTCLQTVTQKEFYWCNHLPQPNFSKGTATVFTFLVLVSNFLRFRWIRFIWDSIFSKPKNKLLAVNTTSAYRKTHTVPFIFCSQPWSNYTDKNSDQNGHLKNIYVFLPTDLSSVAISWKGHKIQPKMDSRKPSSQKVQFKSSLLAFTCVQHRTQEEGHASKILGGASGPWI